MNKTERKLDKSGIPLLLAMLNGEWSTAPPTDPSIADPTAYAELAAPLPDSVSRIQYLLKALKEMRPQAKTEINEFLGEYTSRQSVEWDSKTGWKVLEDSPPRDLLRRRRVMELVCIREIMKVAKENHLDKLRTCDCGKWFYARRQDQKSCGSSRCRQKRYEQTGEFLAHGFRWDSYKKYRCDYMRWFYAMYQSPKAPKKKITFKQWLKQPGHKSK